MEGRWEWRDDRWEENLSAILALLNFGPVLKRDMLSSDSFLEHLKLFSEFFLILGLNLA